MDAQHLSKRLTRVAHYVPAGARLADIGSDHAYLPAHLLMTDQVAYAVAGDVVKGPYDNMVKEVTQQGLTGRLIPRLADGLAAIEPTDHIDTITIAGMGGSLITKILAAHPERLAGVQRLILQPNVGAAGLREWLITNRYQIIAEEIFKEADHIYELIVAEPSVNPVAANDRELLFGPLLLEEESAVFRDYWTAEADRTAYAIQQMAGAHQETPRLRDYQARLALIQEVLAHDYRQ